MTSVAKIAVAGAGLYGATAAIRLAEHGHRVHLFDPLGIMRAASAINQYRVHSGYHYPRSPETIDEILEGRQEFLEAFHRAIVRNTQHYYAIPKQHSRTPPDLYERVMSQHGLPLRPSRPDWLNFDFVDRCYQVEEHIYNPDVLRTLIERRIEKNGVQFRQRAFRSDMRSDYDFVIWAAYGRAGSEQIFKFAKLQVAEKILIKLPAMLRRIALVVVDGPFTAFDPFGSSDFSLFGSAEHTNHWSTSDSAEPIPALYSDLLNKPTFVPVPFTHFEAMRNDCCRAVPSAKDAVYLGSRFTIRVVEDNPTHDRRILHVREGEPGEFHIFSGKIVSAVKAARLVCERISNGG